jgi:hypothetical protein
MYLKVSYINNDLLGDYIISSNLSLIKIEDNEYIF